MARGSSPPIASPIKPTPAEDIPEAKEDAQTAQPEKKEWVQRIRDQAVNYTTDGSDPCSFHKRMLNWFANVYNLHRLYVDGRPWLNPRAEEVDTYKYYLGKPHMSFLFTED